MGEGQLKCDTGVIRADVMTPGSFNCVGVGEPCLPASLSPHSMSKCESDMNRSEALK